MTNRISVGKRDKKWGKYGIEQIPMLVNKVDTKTRILVKNGEFVSVVGNHYRVLPNELAVEIANKSAQMTNLRPFSDFGNGEGLRMNGQVHVLENNWKIHAMYDSGRDVTIAGDKVKLGVSVHNSIDGSLGFGVGIFSYRFTCSNMAFAGFRGQDVQGKTLEWIYSRHTDSLTGAIDVLQEKMVRIMDKVHLIADSYKEMARRKATEEFIKKIRESKLTKRIMPEYLKTEELEVPDLSEWDIYNGLTQGIWHNGDANLDTKITQFGHLHRVIPLTPSQSYVRRS